MAIKLAIDGTDMSPSPCTDFRNAGRPVQSKCYPYTEIFIGIDSLYNLCNYSYWPADDFCNIKSIINCTNQPERKLANS